MHLACWAVIKCFLLQKRCLLGPCWLITCNPGHEVLLQPCQCSEIVVYSVLLVIYVITISRSPMKVFFCLTVKESLAVYTHRFCSHLLDVLV